jgi:hypothetical protein
MRRGRKRRKEIGGRRRKEEEGGGTGEGRRNRPEFVFEGDVAFVGVAFPKENTRRGNSEQGTGNREQGEAEGGIKGTNLVLTIVTSHWSK